MGAIYLVRHGQASFGTANYDKLSELGAEQAAHVGDELRRREARVARVLCGTLVRQCDTARHAGFDATTDERFNEYDFTDVLQGAATMTDPRGFQAAFDEALAAWVEAGSGGSYGEPWSVFTGRVNAAFDDVVDGLGSGRDAVVFTSGGVIGALAARALGDQDRGFLRLQRVVCNAGITKVVVGRSGISLVSFNEHGHLEGGGGTMLTYR